MSAAILQLVGSTTAARSPFLTYRHSSRDDARRDFCRADPTTIAVFSARSASTRLARHRAPRSTAAIGHDAEHKGERRVQLKLPLWLPAGRPNFFCALADLSPPSKLTIFLQLSNKDYFNVLRVHEENLAAVGGQKRSSRSLAIGAREQRDQTIARVSEKSD